MTSATAQALRWQPLTRGRRGFTLIELLVTMAVIAILAGILLPVIHIARTQAKVSSAKNLLSQMVGSLSRYNEDWGNFPPDKINTGTPIVLFEGYDPKNGKVYMPGPPTCTATAEALYYYLANSNITRNHPYLELQVDVQFKPIGDYGGQNQLPVVCDPWERPFLYNRPAFAGQSSTYFNEAGDPIHHVSTYDLFSVGPNGQTAQMDVPHPKTNFPLFNDKALHAPGNSGKRYGEDNDDIASWK